MSLLTTFMGEARALVWALCIGLLVSCGGTTTPVAGGVGSGGTGSGTVSGFGSVIVDGNRYDDSDASVLKLMLDGTEASASVLLGQHVVVQFDADSKAQSIHIRPQLVGVVTRLVDPIQGRAEVNGQPVRVLSEDDTTPLGKATWLNGYDSRDALQPGDEVEVHGFWYTNAQGQTELAATRLDKLNVNATASGLLVNGLVAQLICTSASAASRSSDCLLQLNASTIPGSGLWVQTSDSRCLQGVAAGDAVTVTLSRDALSTLAFHAATPVQPLTAPTCQRTSLRASDVPNGVLKISGLPTQFDSTAKTVRINGTEVSLSSVDPAQVQAIAQTTYLSMDVQISDAQLTPSSVRLRNTQMQSSDSTGLVTFISGWQPKDTIDWHAQTVTFILRGVRIQAAASVVAASDCSRYPSGNALWISVQGSISTPGPAITASAIRCVSAASP